MDMSEAYHKAVSTHLKKATIVFDHFHVVKLFNDKLSDLRGVLTPAAAMGDALLARFPAAGVSLRTERLN